MLARSKWFALAVAIFGFAATAHAAPKLYAGTITVHAFGNDTTTGSYTTGLGMTSTGPGKATTFAVKSYYAHPFEKYCNTVYIGTGPLGKSLGMGNPTDPCMTTPTFHSKSNDLVGGGIISTATMFVTTMGMKTVTASPPALIFGSANVGDLAFTGKGSFSYIFPYLISKFTATVYNGAGTFFAGGGPGSFVAKGFGPIKARAQVTAGANKFGGTLRLLGTVQSYGYYQNKGGSISIGYFNWLWTVIGGKCGAGGCVKSPAYNVFSTLLYNTAGFNTTTFVRAVGWPWTTGMVTVTATVGPLPTILHRSGYDNRTSLLNNGRIQLVTPKLTRWATANYATETGGIGMFTIDVGVAPEPGSLLLLGGGLSALGLLYRSRMRR